ncbi:hypothetical protein D3879_15435 [Pseudomonas cavernicola]|uniref:Bulb-type lectin domain-containing protein n=1 Tax=Pseudomonas cavernicola TaxID=2320866 RepID=A0A418XEV8_9PSED|nr:hypothetical protein D3879_15435 [Pseudomonas cavernicola]
MATITGTPGNDSLWRFSCLERKGPRRNAMTHTCSPSPARRNGIAVGKVLFASLCLVLLALTERPAHGVLLTETTWGGAGAEVATAVATAADGSAYLVGSTDSFAVDEFNQPATRMFIVKLSNGAVVWQRIWNGPTIVGVTNTSVAVAADGSVYVAGITADGGGNAVLLKFDPDGTLLWERAWGGTESDSAGAVATHSDGSVYVAGRTTSFGPSSAGVFVLKFDPTGALVWQRYWDDAAGFEAMAVTPDGSVYAASSKLRGGNLAQFDVMVLKLTDAGALVWARTYGAGEVVDARGGMAAAADGSIYTAGAIQAAKGGIVGISALVLNIGSDGSLLFGKECCTKDGDTGEGIAVAPDGSVLLAGTTTALGVGFQDAFVARLESTGKKVTAAATWGGTGFETGGGVAAAADNTVRLAATTSQGPPYSLLAASLKLSAPKFTVATPAGALVDPGGTVSTPPHGASEPAGSTTYSGNFEAALIWLTLP